MFYDCHLHLTECFESDSIMGYSRSVPTKLFTVSVGIEDARRNLELGQRFPGNIRVFVGIHPSEAARNPHMEELEPLSKDADGIGEVGLDPGYSPVTADSAQTRIFSEQLLIADRQSKPIQVHSRGAEKTIIDILGSFHIPSVLLHWFEGEEFLREAEDRGYYISIGPAALSSGKLKRIAKSYPTNLLLTESDAPVAYRSFGVPLIGPQVIPSLVFFLAQLKGVDFGEMEATLAENSKQYLKGIKKG